MGFLVSNKIMEQILASGREKDAILEGLEAIKKGEISETFNSIKEAVEFLNNLEV